MDGSDPLRSQCGAERPFGERKAVPSILDILDAVREVAPHAPTVDAWWLAARSRLEVDAARPSRPRALVELVIQGKAVTADVTANLAVRLSAALRGASVRLRLAEAPGDTRSLFRLFTKRAVA
ncbi:MAG: hypothetical protein ABSC94_20125 [Polyangiaceae bacterium]|jgi:hypothetical protein